MGVLINKMSVPENNHNGHYRDESVTEIPSAIDQRPPQRNDDNISCHCECLCSGATKNTKIDIARSTTAHQAQPDEQDNSHNNNNNNDDDNDDDEISSYISNLSINGEEGIPDHLIEVGDLGFVSLGLIHRSLARHTRCTCHSGILPEADDYPFLFPNSHSSPMSSVLHSSPRSSSLLVEAGSGEHSMMSSQVLSVCSRSSSVLFGMGMGMAMGMGMGIGAGQPFSQGAVVPTVWNPLRLTEEVRLEYHHPAEMSVGRSAFGGGDNMAEEFDFW